MLGGVVFLSWGFGSARDVVPDLVVESAASISFLDRIRNVQALTGSVDVDLVILTDYHPTMNLEFKSLINKALFFEPLRNRRSGNRESSKHRVVRAKSWITFVGRPSYYPGPCNVSTTEHSRGGKEASEFGCEDGSFC